MIETYLIGSVGQSLRVWDLCGGAGGGSEVRKPIVDRV